MCAGWPKLKIGFAMPMQSVTCTYLQMQLLLLKSSCTDIAPECTFFSCFSRYMFFFWYVSVIYLFMYLLIYLLILISSSHLSVYFFGMGEQNFRHVCIFGAISVII